MPLSSSDNDFSQFRDYRTEHELYTRRIAVSLAVIVLLFGILVYRFYDLQVVDHQHYVTRSDSNRIQVQPLPPTRGLIFDRNGVLLADNRATYRLSVVRERTRDLDSTIEMVASLIDVSDSDKDSFYKALRQRRRPYESVPLRYRLTEEEIAAIAVNEYRLDGVEVEAELTRHYPYGPLFAHVIGYVGRINETELANFDAETYRNYSGTHNIGKTGLERYYEADLLGEVGNQHIETNAHGRVLRVLGLQDPVPGKDIHLHLDIHLQQIATEAMGGHRGAVVAIDVTSGGVLALVSTPSFDPNLFVTGISYKDYQALNESPDLPLYNRAIQGQYPPGSLLKPMLGVGALEAGSVDPSYRIRDPGFFIPFGDTRVYRDWKKGGHGPRVDLNQAIVESCDTYFYDLSIRMGIDLMHPLGEAFGLGKRSGVDIPNERAGLWPSRAWKRGARGQPWYPGDSLNVSIGQGDVLTTPMQMVVMTTGLALQGDLIQPRIVARAGDEQVSAPVIDRWVAQPEHWDYVYRAMRDVVHGTRGTARVMGRGAQYSMAGKTGTAQVISIAQDQVYDREKILERQRDHALFVAFAPVENPRVAVAVIVENGEHGSTVAAPVARKVFDAWFEKNPLPDRQAGMNTKAGLQ